ncbi:hypothetical protein [Rhizobium sp. AG855]|uniref:hypothetical protein n=1 Tax=Rhizobium sp. AG855 TaxID=2183898 RepID=UPI000E72E64A|nr:hypothetical protein [Rhizobium sp. AG855]RKE84690.1 hypothetical protein DFO46_1461 [Rhizobium sp. AG855]
MTRQKNLYVLRILSVFFAVFVVLLYFFGLLLASFQQERLSELDFMYMTFVKMTLFLIYPIFVFAAMFAFSSSLRIVQKLGGYRDSFKSFSRTPLRHMIWDELAEEFARDDSVRR